MKYVIMCGGRYDSFATPRHLLEINGEKIVERTIRLLRENGVEDIVITSNDPRFDNLGVPRLEHNNTFRYENRRLTGYWLDAFYPFDNSEKVCYIFGDVYFADTAIKTIVECQRDGNIMFGTGFATLEGKGWGEPFAYKVNDMTTFRNGINAVKKLQDEGKTNRHPVVWELYRYLNNIDVNYHKVLDTTYVPINDGSIDVDSQNRYKTVKEEVETGRKISVIIPVYNRPKLLKRAIESIPKRCDLEVIVVDDGSTDGTTDFIEENENLRVIKLPYNQGVSAARNKGIEEARGKYILMLDSDDYIITEKFFLMDLWLNTNDMVYYNLIANNGFVHRLNNDSKELWCGTTKFIRKDFIGDTRYPVGVNVGEDLVFTKELLKKNPTEVFSDVTLIHYNHPRVEI